MKIGMETNETTVEQRIVAAAKQVFIEKGFAETCMNDIAVRAGINRSGLHYYFRTKERMFEAVYADIVFSFIPTIHDIIMSESPLRERLSEVVDVYFNLFRTEPGYPLFLVRELHRNADYVLSTIHKLEIEKYAVSVVDALRSGMASGVIRTMPVEFVVYTFFGLVAVPFMSRPLVERIGLSGGRSFEESLPEWKECVMSQMMFLLTGKE